MHILALDSIARTGNGIKSLPLDSSSVLRNWFSRSSLTSNPFFVINVYNCVSLRRTGEREEVEKGDAEMILQRRGQRRSV